MNGVSRLEMPVDRGRVEVPALNLVIVEPGELHVVEIVEHLLDAEEVARARIEAGADAKQPYVLALNETESRPEVLRNLPQDELRIVFVVRVLRRNAPRDITAMDTFVDAAERVRVEHD